MKRTWFAAFGAIPQGKAGGTESPANIVARQRREIGERAQSPAGEYRCHFGRWLSHGERQRSEKFLRVDHAEDGVVGRLVLIHCRSLRGRSKFICDPGVTSGMRLRSVANKFAPTFRRCLRCE